MISKIRISDISKHNFVYKHNFLISDISNCNIDIKIQLMISLNDLMISIIQFLISLFQFLTSLNDLWYLKLIYDVSKYLEISEIKIGDIRNSRINVALPFHILHWYIMINNNNAS